jgi:hypothetical protein
MYTLTFQEVKKTYLLALCPFCTSIIVANWTVGMLNPFRFELLPL